MVNFVGAADKAKHSSLQDLVAAAGPVTMTSLAKKHPFVSVDGEATLYDVAKLLRAHYRRVPVCCLCWIVVLLFMLDCCIIIYVGLLYYYFVGLTDGLVCIVVFFPSISRLIDSFFLSVPRKWSDCQHYFSECFD